MPEEINEALLEGESCNNWTPGSWANAAVGADDEWQPDIEPPRINDYAAFKKHKHYGKYFRPYRYIPFPATVYHQTLGSAEVKSKEEVIALGPDWTRFIPVWHHQIKGTKTVKSQDEVESLGVGWRPCEFDPESKGWIVKRDMTGKCHPVKTETQNLAEVIGKSIAAKQGPIDANSIAAIVAAVMAATQKPAEKVEAEAGDDMERSALLELAEKHSVKVDKRWGNDRIKKELGI